MFDYLRCRHPLPVAGLEDEVFQTKDLCCLMDNYEIRADGTLWGEDYDIEDRSDPNATGLAGLAGSLTKTNVRPRFMDISETIRFYPECSDAVDETTGKPVWLEFEAVFVSGHLLDLRLLPVA